MIVKRFNQISKKNFSFVVNACRQNDKILRIEMFFKILPYFLNTWRANSWLRAFPQMSDGEKYLMILQKTPLLFLEKLILEILKDQTSWPWIMLLSMKTLFSALTRKGSLSLGLMAPSQFPLYWGSFSRPPNNLSFIILRRQLPI